MTDFKVGDIVRFDNTRSMKIDYLDGHEGRVVGATTANDNVEVMWNEPLPLFEPFDENEPRKPVTWSQYLSEKYLTLVKPKVDQDTVDAILKALRESGRLNAANYVVEQFSVPKTRTVSVNFQVPEGESVVDYLENVSIDYDIEGGN